ncbi:hypothetical protein [Jannaschia sp. LMIT008]|uniref:hypothetical protein n=1 Tax=Jannaschia maritima TaxID=3032585 RepID=UPI0028125FC4|nr:hypothetical protein [Jannaschia sp. LMIT008]
MIHREMVWSLAAAVSLASPAWSDDAFCADWSRAEVARAVAGTWNGTTTVTVTAQGYTQVMGPGPSTITHQGSADGGTFTVADAAPPMPSTYEWTFMDTSLAADDLVAKGSAPIGVTLDEMGLVLGCDPEDVPQLYTEIEVATGEVQVSGCFVTLVFSPSAIATVGTVDITSSDGVMTLSSQSAGSR